ncbi:MAG TPA: hypothetical protein VI522_00745 [Gammaproteobacteria bacterium]|nr:hypothetical protein [Gammaproteobacteria bacterium]
MLLRHAHTSGYKYHYSSQGSAISDDWLIKRRHFDREQIDAFREGEKGLHEDRMVSQQEDGPKVDLRALFAELYDASNHNEQSNQNNHLPAANDNQHVENHANNNNYLMMNNAVLTGFGVNTQPQQAAMTYAYAVHQYIINNLSPYQIGYYAGLTQQILTSDFFMQKGYYAAQIEEYNLGYMHGIMQNFTAVTHPTGTVNFTVPRMS